ncbi:MAG: hypothetical protein ACREMB_02625 [Candidatus Rokuibacteriota bacterium]
MPRRTTSRRRAPSGLVTRRKLAAGMDVVPARITKWESEGCPVAVKAGGGRPSLFDPQAVRAWLAAREQESSARNGVGALPVERAREARARAQLAEQTLQIRTGELVPTAAIEAAWLELHEAVATTVRAIPRLADRLVLVAREEGARGVERVLGEAVEQAMQELSGWKPART